MMRNLSIGTLLASALATAAFAAPPDPGNLTGTWDGEMKCKFFDGQEVAERAFEGSLDVFDEDGNLSIAPHLSLGGNPAVTVQGGEYPATMCGVVRPKRPAQPASGVGSISSVGANGAVPLAELGALQVVAIRTKTYPENEKEESGKLTGKGLLFPTGVTGGCRWKFVRTSVAQPPVDVGFCITGGRQ